MLPDYYAILGVSASASSEELRRAWRARAFELHPDRNPGDEGRGFRAAAEAWDILSDPGSRARYDQVRTASPFSPPRGGSTPSGAWPSPSTAWAEAARRAQREADERQKAEALRRAQEEARARRILYEAEQLRLEAELGLHLGDWTRSGVLRDGSLGRRR